MNHNRHAIWLSIAPYLDETPRSATEIARISGISPMNAQWGLRHARYFGLVQESFRAPTGGNSPMALYSKLARDSSITRPISAE
jgi:hypothetical protein